MSAPEDVKGLIAVVDAMFDEYMRDEQCDYTKINAYIEEAKERTKAIAAWNRRASSALQGLQGEEQNSSSRSCPVGQGNPTLAITDAQALNVIALARAAVAKLGPCPYCTGGRYFHRGERRLVTCPDCDGAGELPMYDLAKLQPFDRAVTPEIVVALADGAERVQLGNSGTTTNLLHGGEEGPRPAEAGSSTGQGECAQ